MYFDNPSLAAKDAYVPGLSREWVARKYGIPLDDVAKLGSAENPFGPSPKALAVVRDAKGIDNYPVWTAQPLREKIAAKYGYSPDQVICGAGETEIIPWITRGFCGKGEKVLMFVPAFPIYHMVAEAEGRVPVYVRMDENMDFRWDEFLAAIKPDVRIVFLTNPHSPTGRLLPLDRIRQVCRTAKDQLVVLDEAYIHFSRTNGGMDLLREFDNLIVLRTFSKAFGLAGLRVGFGIAARPEIIAPMLHLKPTWNMGQLQMAGAIAALDDDEHVTKTVDMIWDMRNYVTDRINAIGRYSIVGEPRSNFFLLRIDDPALDSTMLFDELVKRGVIVKDGSVSFIGLGKRYMRSDVSFRKHMDRLVNALAEIHAEMRVTA
jgi:histidinol-phosphate aminotransferase